MKIAITGKGGTGKTTVCGCLARIFAQQGEKVYVIDADPDMNAATVLGIPGADRIRPMTELKELIAERTETEVGKPAPVYKMNPKVDDIPETYSALHQGVRLLVLGSVREGGAGCACPENTFLRRLLSHLVLARDEMILLDMEAGIEHLGRGSTRGVDLMLVVVEPARTSVETALRIRKLAGDLGIKKLAVIGNKIRSDKDREYLVAQLPGFAIAGWVPDSDNLRDVSRGETDVFALPETSLEPFTKIAGQIAAEG